MPEMTDNRPYDRSEVRPSGRSAAAGIAGPGPFRVEISRIPGTASEAAESGRSGRQTRQTSVRHREKLNNRRDENGV